MYLPSKIFFQIKYIQPLNYNFMTDSTKAIFFFFLGGGEGGEKAEKVVKKYYNT